MQIAADSATQLAAWILLVVYGAVAVILLPRELAFLVNVEQPHKARFILLDILIQCFFLLVLLPPALALLTSLTGFIILGIGFLGLWIVVIATAILRYRYVHSMLASQQEKLKQEYMKKRSSDSGGGASQ